MKTLAPARRHARWIAAPLCATLPLVCFAQERVSQAPLETIVVTATRLPQPVEDVVADISVIGPAEIERAGQSTLRELLQRLPGVQMSTNGSYASNTTVFIRGAETARIMVLVDGVRIGSATSGTAPLESIPLAQIERIEVLRGPATTLYGADAVGGVIQIFTRRGEPGLRVSAEAGVGSHGLMKSSAAIDGAQGNFAYAPGVSAERADGISTLDNRADSDFNDDDDGYRNTGVSGSLRWTLAPGHTLSTQFLAANGRSEFDGVYSDPESFTSPLGLEGHTTSARNRARMLSWGIALDNRMGERWQSSLRLSLSDDKSKAIYRSSESGALDGAYRFDTRRRQFVWQNTFSIGPDRVIASLERLEDEVDSTVAYTVDERHTDSVLLAYALDRGPWFGQIAARHDDNSQFGTFTTGSAALGYRLTKAWRVVGTYASNFQGPSFNQLYYPDFGNPDLEPQRNRGHEMALKYDDGAVHGSLTLYRNRIRGFIDPGTNVQTSRATLKGATLEGGWRHQTWSVGGSIDVLDADEEPTGRRLVRRAGKTAQLHVERRAGWGSAFAEWLAVADRVDNDFASFPSRRVRLGGYGLLNLGAQWRLATDWTLLARVNNATDKDYASAYGYSTLGRTVFVGLQYRGTVR